MIKAILLDLDNTLIQNADYPFAKAFLSKIEAYYQQETGYAGAAIGFRQGLNDLQVHLNAMTTPLLFNQQTIVSGIADSMNLDVATAGRLLDEFYATQYQDLQSFIQPIAGAKQLIEQLLNDGYAVVIATNPLYSHRAITDRMVWGDLPTDNVPYALITNAEIMHFSKPNPAYYSEVIARVGIEPDEAIVIGDSIKNDIEPAHEAGLLTYHITNDIIHPIADAGGTLSDFYTTLKQNTSWQNSLDHKLKPSMILPELRGTLGALYGFLANVQPEYWHQKPADNEWSIIQILCHLWQYEINHERPRLERILNEETPFIVAATAPGPNLKICHEDGYFIARQFEEERRRTIRLIKDITEEQWHRPAKHSIFGNTTLLEMAHFTAQHDRLHLNQLCQTIGRCARES